MINFPEEKTSDEDVSTMIAETLEALNEAREKSGASESEVLFGGVEQELEKLAAAIDESLSQDGEGQGGSSSQESEEEQIASRTTEELTVALKEQIDQASLKLSKEMAKYLLLLGLEELFRQALPILPMRRSGS